MRVIWPMSLALIWFAAPVSALEVEPGQTVRLVEREIHIPAHPGPGENAIPFRFVSGSLATVLNIHEDTEWIELRGEALNMPDPRTAWVAPRFIASVEDGDGDGPLDPDPLAWCPDKGTPGPHPSGRLRIATWNLGNLHAQDGQSIFPDSEKRAARDYERIRCYVRLFDPDILAVQAVDGEWALARVVDTDVYAVHVSDRPQGLLGGQQNTGFAFKKGLSVAMRADFEALNTSGDARHGTRIDLTHNDRTIHLMSVHLKSGCFENGSTSSACSTLEAQVPVLEDWMDDAAGSGVPFIVLGDFNRRLNRPGDTVWREWDDGDPVSSDLTNGTADRPISCRDNEVTTFIDHILFDQQAASWVDPSSFRHMTFRQADRDKWDVISDHCPVIVEMWVNPG